MSQKTSAILKFGNPELDHQIGGIPIPTLLLIEGPNDSGKSVLAQQIAYGAVIGNLRVRYVTTENTFTGLINHMKNLSYNIKRYVKIGSFKITELHTGAIEWDAKIASIYLEAMAEFLKNDLKSNVIIVDSLTYIVTHAEEQQILEFFSQFRNYVDNAKKTIVLTVHPYAFNQDLLIRIRSICDGHIILSMKEMGNKVLRVMEVAKLKGAVKSSVPLLSFEVDSAFGIKILPFTRAKA
jgi:flagellar protein FlaH